MRKKIIGALAISSMALMLGACTTDEEKTVSRIDNGDSAEEVVAFDESTYLFETAIPEMETIAQKLQPIWVDTWQKGFTELDALDIDTWDNNLKLLIEGKEGVTEVKEELLAYELDKQSKHYDELIELRDLIVASLDGRLDAYTVMIEAFSSENQLTEYSKSIDKVTLLVTEGDNKSLEYREKVGLLAEEYGFDVLY